MYDRIYGIIMLGVAWYTWYLIALFFMVHILTKRKEKQYQAALESVVEELKDILIEEEPIMSKNKLTLTDLLTRKATKEEYEEVASLLIKLFQKAYEDDKYLVVKSDDETKDTNFMQIVSHPSEWPELHKEIFSKGMRYGIEMKDLLPAFVDKVCKGELIDLGDNAVVIDDDNTGNPPTGVSPINSGLEDSQLSCIISFIKLENLPEWRLNTFPDPEEEETNE